MPTIIDNKCYIDGGVMCNYPINYCLRDHANKDEILGFRLTYKTEGDNFQNIKVTSESSLLEYVISITINSMNYIRDTVKELEKMNNGDPILKYHSDKLLELRRIAQAKINIYRKNQLDGGTVATF